MMQLGYSHFTALRTTVNDQILLIGKSGAVSYVYAVDNGTGKLVRNRLYHVSDLQSNAAAFSEDIDDQGSFTAPNQNSVSNVNYAYTEIGELAKDKAEHIDSIKWNVYGKVERIYFNNGKPSVQYLYDASGNRVAKLLKNINANAVVDTTYASTYYWRDAQGNVLATESKKYFSVGSTTSVNHATEVEYVLLGSARLGVYQDTIPYDITTYTPYGKYKRYGARRQYELSTYNANVMATVSDVKTFAGVGYKAKVLSAQMYMPYGMIHSSRTYKTNNYSSLFKNKYGFNGMEMDNEVLGGFGKWYTFGDFGLDPRRIVRNNPDPVVKPWQSPYATFANNPILFADPSGYDEGVSNTGDSENPREWNKNDVDRHCTDICEGDLFQATAKKPIPTNPNIAKSDNSNIGINSNNLTKRYTAQEKNWKSFLADKARYTGSITKTDPMNGMSDYERVMITSPVVQATSISILAPEMIAADLSWKAFIGKSALSSTIQYAVTGKVDVVDAAADGALGLGASAIVGPAADKTYNFKRGEWEDFGAVGLNKLWTEYGLGVANSYLWGKIGNGFGNAAGTVLENPTATKIEKRLVWWMFAPYKEALPTLGSSTTEKIIEGGGDGK